MIDQEIIYFVSAQVVATICCTAGGESWCFNCFYLFLPEEGLLVFKSSPGSKHQEMMAPGSKIAGSILPASINFAALQGVQLQAVVVTSGDEYAAAYYQKFPMGKDMPGKIWCLRLTTLKLTDNARGFGFKQTWRAAE